MSGPSSLEEVIRYHERTKHQPGRFARSPGYLDWAHKPDPFRRYQGAAVLRLDEIAPDSSPSFDELYAPRQLPSRAVDRSSVSQLLYDSLALSAWKSFGEERWSLRCNPSSGNLHPTEAYLLTGPVDGLSERGGLFHYSPFDHGLECRTELSDERWRSLHGELPVRSLLVGLTSIHWREAWKYGERAYRYCQHDVGHAIAALSYAAAALGWQVQVLDGVSDEECGALLGIEGQRGPEAEHPDALLWVRPHGDVEGPSDPSVLRALSPWRPSPALLALLRDAPLAGTPNRLSSDHQPWPAIDDVAAAAVYPGREHERPSQRPGRNGEVPPGARDSEAHRAAVTLSPVSSSGRRLLRQRRSAVAMDGSTSIDRPSFYRMLCRLLPAVGTPPLDGFSWRPAVHLVLFVHRVSDLEPGVYALVRDPGAVDRFRAALDDELRWSAAPGRPEGLPLYRLESGDVRLAARRLSCDQAIASDGAFAVAMVADFDGPLQAHGPWFYRRLFWEAGAIGQVLYLEAEAAGLRGCGIGCFFDEAVHGALGLSGRQFQSLYHFTVGGPVPDPRLRTLPGYAHRSPEEDSDNVGGTTRSGLF